MLGFKVVPGNKPYALRIHFQIDNYTIYGPTPQKKEALISFLKALKTLYPELKVMQNAGLEVLEETHHFIDAVAVESIASNYDFDKNPYQKALLDKK